MRKLFFCLFLISCFSLSADASQRIHPNTQQLINEAQRLGLHKDITWQRLLHLHNKYKASDHPIGAGNNGRSGHNKINRSNRDRHNNSAVISDGFFVSQPTQTQSIAQSELIASIQKILASKQGDDQAFICKYPARYIWLKRYLEFPSNLTLAGCQSFLTWSGLDALESVSLILVSAYLGNPASTFGHVLIKFNSEGSATRGRMFDTSVNFGASVPPGESSLVYIYKGIVGGYKAGFKQKSFFEDDLVYTNAEFRDLWEYRLNLDNFQTSLFVAHLWELTEHNFDYFFFKQNCGYRIGEILELVLQDKVFVENRFWYAPVSLFESLQSYANNGQPLVENINYFPSPQRNAFGKFESLSRNQKGTFNEFFDATNEPNLAPEFINDDRLIDAMLSYSTYRKLSVDSEDTENKKMERQRQWILTQRLAKPPDEVGSQYLLSKPDLPTTGSSPARLAIERNISGGDLDSTTINYSPFYYDKLSLHGQRGSELVLFNGQLEYFENQNKFGITRLDLLRIQKVDTTTPAITDENGLSWNLGVSLNNENSDCQLCLEPEIAAGVGRAVQVKRNHIGIFFFNAFVSDSQKQYGIRPTLEWLTHKKNYSWNFGVEYEALTKNSDESMNVFAKFRYRFNRNAELQFNFDKEDEDTIGVSLRLYH